MGMAKIHLISEQDNQRFYIKDFSDKINVTFNKYKAMAFESVKEAQKIANLVNKAQDKRVYTVAIMQYFDELETVKVSIDSDKINVNIGMETLLFTKNNITAYPKLMKVLNDIEGLNYKVWFDRLKILDIKDKDTFIEELVKFLSN